MLTEKVRAIVVDDERYAREELVYLLTEQLHVDVVAEASSGEEAIVQADQHEPDVLFLDVSMGKMGGIETAEDALEFLMAGATAVSVGTANFYNPTATVDVATGIET